MRKTVLLAILIFSGLLCAFQLQKYALDNGGAQMGSATYASRNSLGEALVGKLSSSNFSSESGIFVNPSGDLKVDSRPSTPEERISIHSAVPTPFNSSCEILFSVPQDGKVTVEIFALDGRTVLARSQELSAGTHSLVWTPNKDLPSGIYVVRISSAAGQDVKDVLFVK